MKKETIDKLNYALSESNNLQVVSDVLLETSKISEIKDMFQYLLGRYKNENKLLTELFQHKSDACNLEATEMEKMENEFESFVFMTQNPELIKTK